MNDLKLFKHGDEGTHGCCNKRLEQEGSKARCCQCEPHEGCESMQHKEDWEKEFDKKFEDLCEYDEFRDTWIPRQNVIKRFIHDLLAKIQQETMANMIDLGMKGFPMGTSQWKSYGLKYGYWDYFEKEVKQKVLELIGGIKVDFPHWPKEGNNFHSNLPIDCVGCAKKESYNRALEDIKSKLKKL